jgi:glycosyltransferase involved in cell wall biosynthesis
VKQRVSIIIPAYNEERYLSRCLDSVAAQVEKPFEVIVVDNNSADKTIEIARRYPFVRVVQESQQGRVYARNAGFAAARGDVLGRIDADAVLPPNWTAQVTAYFNRPGAMRSAWTGGPLFYNVRFPRVVSGIYDALAFGFNWFLAGHPTLWGSNMAIPKVVWEEVQHDVCLRNDVHEDLDLAIHVHRHGHPIVYDRHTKVRVQLRRVRSSRRELWGYLQWWPRTLRVHGLITWPICWLFGDVLLFAVTPLFDIVEHIARAFGRRPLED